jgi:hypothetical protein
MHPPSKEHVIRRETVDRGPIGHRLHQRTGAFSLQKMPRRFVVVPAPAALRLMNTYFPAVISMPRAANAIIAAAIHPRILR